ncbi:MAG: pseudouridine synthase [Betaproteobacteria bacterium]
MSDPEQAAPLPPPAQAAHETVPAETQEQHRDSVDPQSASSGEVGPRSRRRRDRRGRTRGRPQAQASESGQVQSAQAGGRERGPDRAAYRFEDVVAGQLDADEQDPALEMPRRVLPPQPESPKLHKVLAQAGLGSRLDMEQLILEGRISVNNEPAHIGQRIQFGDAIKVNGKPLRVRIAPPPPRVIAYHKPVGEVVTHDDPQNRPTVFRKLPRLTQGKWQSVGRLDLNTEGLLLFTNSGELANKLMHPRFGLEREYAVRVLGALSAEEKTRLIEGVTLEDGPARFGTIEEAGNAEGVNCWYRVTIAEGRNREVRRLFEAVGHAVSRLIRIRYGAFMLPRGLRRGVFVELDDHDISQLTRILRQAEGRDKNQGRRRPERAAGPQQGPTPGGHAPDDGAMPARSDAPPVAEQDDLEELGPYEFQPPPGRHGPARLDDGTGSGRRRRGRGKGPRPGSPQPGFNLKPSGGGNKRSSRGGTGANSASGQPDPMKTSFGYIGADTFTRQREGQGKPRGGNRAGRKPGRG